MTGEVKAGVVKAGVVKAGVAKAGLVEAAGAATGDNDPKLAAMSFEDALAELERIVQGLEGGKQRLEDAIGAYERGAALRSHCEAKLRQAEMRVERIVTGRAGTAAAVFDQGPARTEPLDAEDIPF